MRRAAWVSPRGLFSFKFDPLTSWGIERGALNSVRTRAHIAPAEATGSLPQNINFAIKSAIIRTFLDAHQVGYETAPSTTKMEAADVAEAASKSTFLLVCLKYLAKHRIKAPATTRRSRHAR
jgi:hypothetical protein